MILFIKIYFIGFVIAWLLSINHILKGENKQELKYYFIYCLFSWVAVLLTIYLYFKE